MFVDDFNYSPHVGPAGFRKLIGATGEEDFKSRGGRNDPVTARRLAETEQRLGQAARSVRLYYAARNVYDSIGAWQQEDDPKFEEYLNPCRAALDEAEFAAAVEDGRAMTMEQAIAYALEISANA